MAENNQDPVLAELVRSVNESDQSAVPVPLAVPVTLTVRGAVLRGSLIAERSYFTEIVEASPLMDALDPEAATSGRYLHLRAAGDEGEDAALWRIGLDAVDAWTLHATASSADQEDPR
jgi:hypothetical protein